MDSEAVNQWLDADQVRAMAESLLISAPPANPIPNESFYGDRFEGFAETVPGQPASTAQPVHAKDKNVQQEVVRDPGNERVARSPFSTQSTDAFRPKVKEVKPGLDQPQDPRPAVRKEISTPKPAEITPPPGARVVPVETQPQAPARTVAGGSPFKIASEQPLREGQPNILRPKKVVQSGPPRKLPFSSRLEAFGVWLKEQIPTQAYFICDRNGEIVVDEVGSEKLVKVARTLAHASSNAGRQVGDEEALGSLHVKIGPERVMEVVPRQSQYGLVVLGLIVPRPLSREAVGSVSRGLGTVLAEQSSPG